MSRRNNNYNYYDLNVLTISNTTALFDLLNVNIPTSSIRENACFNFIITGNILNNTGANRTIGIVITINSNILFKDTSSNIPTSTINNYFKLIGNLIVFSNGAYVKSEFFLSNPATGVSTIGTYTGADIGASSFSTNYVFTRILDGSINNTITSPINFRIESAMSFASTAFTISRNFVSIKEIN